MDGYAVQADDLKRAPLELELIESVPAGKSPTKLLKPGKTIRIMTGAPVPDGADTVVMVEKTEPLPGDKTVRFLEPTPKSINICYQGEDLKKGQKVILAGELIRAQEIGLLAAVGKARVKVFKKPSCAILATGDELVSITTRPTDARIRNTNNYLLSAQLTRLGFASDILGIARDNIDDLTQHIQQGLKYDILILSGGVSVGEYDIVAKVLQELGVKILFNKVAIKPGKPFVFGIKNKHLVFGLPGNPVSCFVITEVFIRPALAELTGNQSLIRPVIQARLSTPFHKVSDRVQYIPAKYTLGKDDLSDSVEPVNWHGSADQAALTRANAFIIIPPNETSKKSVKIMPLA